MKLLFKSIFTLLLVSCSSVETPSYLEILAAGSINNNKYSNSYFGLNLPIPKNWTILNEKTIIERNKMGMDLISKSMDTLGLDSNKDPRVLIEIENNQFDTNGNLQESGGFGISFLKKSYFPNVRAYGFLEEAKKVLLASEYYKNISELKGVVIDDQQFYTFTCELHYQGFVVFQNSYILDMNNCFLLINSSHRGESIKSEIDKILQTVSFSKI